MIFAMTFTSMCAGKIEAMVGLTRNARSKEEAVGIGMRLAWEKFPTDAGWHSHGCIVLQLPADWIAAEKVSMIQRLRTSLRSWHRVPR